MKYTKHIHVSQPSERSPQTPFTGDEPAFVILTGTSDPYIGIDDVVADRIRTAFRGFRGAIISGGTRSGVGALAGDIAKAGGDDVSVYGYLPAQVAGEDRDYRCSQFIETPGPGFSLVEPVTYWRDLLAAGIDPSSVIVLVIGGGAITETEARLAIALGAHVTAFQGSGRAADCLLDDPTWSQCPNLHPAPDSPAELRKLLLPIDA